MVKIVGLTKRAEKSLQRVPPAALNAADVWRGLVEEVNNHDYKEIERLFGS